MGYDSTTPLTSVRLSTTLSFALEGWMTLYRVTGKVKFKDEALTCVEMILSEQDENGLWASPFSFRGNPPNHYYSCENLMTIRPLIHYYNIVEDLEKVKQSIERAISGLNELIGHNKEGCFWYSPTDKIFVPNISSMAAATFAEASTILENSNIIKKAELFANYCINNQRDDGGYNYFSDQSFVYIPYHALELWELNEANIILKNSKLEKSIQRATSFMEFYFQNYFYKSKDSVGRKSKIPFLNKNTMLFKTPVWMSKAFLSRGYTDKAIEHLRRAIRIFSIPNKNYFFYSLYDISILGIFDIYIPNYNSVYMRYNASFFEVGAKLIKEVSDLE